MDDAPGLPTIPHHHLTGADWPLALFHSERDRARRLYHMARKMLPPGLLAFADRQSRIWLDRRDSPFLDEINVIAAELGLAGGYALNLSYEWGCSTRTVARDDGSANRMIRVLDWPLHGTGREVVAATIDRGPRPWTHLTWPGFTGVVQGIAPGRFSAAFNQAPLRRRFNNFAADWVVARVRVAREDGLPPAHLLRLVFERAESFADARDLLAKTPICLPAIFVLSGMTGDEGCIIERREREARIHDGSLGAANHWICPEWDGWPRGVDSPGRGRQIATLAPDFGDGFHWLRPPVLNIYTRLAMIAEAATGRILARGQEVEGPATAPLFRKLP